MARLELKKCPYCGSEVDTVSVKEKDGNLCIEVKAKNIPAANPWIPVSERLPEESGSYLVVYHPCFWDDVEWSKRCVGIDTFRGKTTWAKKKFQRVTHWMPLPEPPEVTQDDNG